MASTQVKNLAALIIERLSGYGPVETLKLQKLLYYCNGWSLALHGRPMFEDSIQAWKHGPVVASVYPLHRRQVVIESWPDGNAAAVPEADAFIAEQVISQYGGFTGWQLREMTHQEQPWLDAWAACGNGKEPGQEIPVAEIEKYFKTLASTS